MEQIIIREFDEKDVIGLAEIYLRIIKEEFHWVDDRYISANDFYSSIEGERVIVATLNENIVGFVSVWEPDKFIHNLFITKEFRRIGVGKKLLDETIKIWGAPLTLKCVKENSNAIKFYFKNGWEFVKEELGTEGTYYLMKYYAQI